MANKTVAAVLAFMPNASTDLIEKVEKAMLTGYTDDLGIPKDVLDNIVMASMGIINTEAIKEPATPRGPTFNDQMRVFLLSLNIPGIEGELKSHGGS